MKDTVGFVGGGRIARIMLSALRRNGFDLSSVSVFDPDLSVRQKTASEFPSVSLCDSLSGIAQARIVFVGVHPPVFSDALRAMKGVAREDALIVSLVPKFTIAKIEELLERRGKVVRMIPNAPSMVSAGYNPVAYSSDINADDRASLDAIFAMMGAFPEVAEDKLERYAILTAMGPTYFFYQMYEIMEIVKSFGLDEEEIFVAMKHMMEGTTAAVFDADLSKAEVLDLIPGKPMQGSEAAIKEMYRTALADIHGKLLS